MNFHRSGTQCVVEVFLCEEGKPTSARQLWSNAFRKFTSNDTVRPMCQGNLRCPDYQKRPPLLGD